MTDLINQLITDWQKEQLNINVQPMAMVGRIMRLGTIYENRATVSLKTHQLSYTEFEVLATLRRVGSPYQLNPKQLMASVLITSGAMTACCDRLEKRQLLSRTFDPTDRRGTLIMLSEQGIALAEKAAQSRFKQANDDVNVLSETEQQQLTALLSKLLA